MLGFRDGRAQSVRSTEFLDEVTVMGERMLAGKAESIRADIRFDEYDSLAVIACKSRVDGIECSFIDDVATNKIAKVEERADGSQHLGRDMAFDRKQINLVSR
jgi:hypothetical protein